MPCKNARRIRGGIKMDIIKSLFVIGASSDVGTALIKAVAQSYQIVWAHYWHWNDHLEEIKTALGDKVRFVRADLSDPSAVNALIAEIKDSGYEPDHIVHFPMAKVFTRKFLKTDWEDFEAGWELSVRSAVMLTRAFLPSMQKKRYGKIIFMLSSCTLDMPPKYEAAYVTVKYAMLGLVKSLAAEFADKGITVNGVSPDMIQTRFISALPHLLVEQYSQTRPSKRILEVEDVVPAFAFLLSEGADSITGENLRIQ